MSWGMLEIEQYERSSVLSLVSSARPLGTDLILLYERSNIFRFVKPENDSGIFSREHEKAVLF